MSKTDTSEESLEALIVNSLVGESDYIAGSPSDYDRDTAVDLVKLTAFLRTTQAENADSLDLDDDEPDRSNFFCLSGDIAERHNIDVLRLIFNIVQFSLNYKF